MTFRGVTLCIALVAGLAACSADDAPATASTTTTQATSSTTTTTTAPERPASTTTTAFDPATVEGEVEAAYLKSWDVYAEAVYNLELDEAALAEVYAGKHLDTVTSEIEDRIEDRRAALVRIDHDYSIDPIDEETAVIIDRYQNHQVLIDPDTKMPIEPDPDEGVVDVVTLKFSGGSWRVTLIEVLE